MGGVLGALGTGPATGGGYGGGMYHAMQDESASASSTKFDDFFEYNVAQPITIHKNESALVPVLQTNVQADRVTLYNANDPAPLRALWLTNSGNVTLDRGSFSIFDNGEFAGEGLMDPIHAGEKRLLSYAVDQAVHVSTEGQRNSSQLRHMTIHDGVLTERVEDVREVTYVVHNAAPDARTVVVEHPVENGWKLTSEVKPAETSASLLPLQCCGEGRGYGAAGGGRGAHGSDPLPAGGDAGQHAGADREQSEPEAVAQGAGAGAGCADEGSRPGRADRHESERDGPAGRGSEAAAR